MTDYQKYINALRKCAKEHENDRTFTGHIIVSDLCKDTANLLEELEQETILDKIIAEINTPNRGTCDYFIVDRIEEIINEYRTESEDKE